MGEIYHHGIIGQKWGVRRYQNKDGSSTQEGRSRNIYRNNIVRNRQYTDDVNSIVRSLSTKDKKLLGAKPDEDWIDKTREYETLTNIGKTFLTKVGDTPVSFVEIWTNGSRTGEIALATRNDPDFRGKGYASKQVDEAMAWVKKYGNKTMDDLVWSVNKDNIPSRKLAEKHGFILDPTKNRGDEVYYRRKV